VLDSLLEPLPARPERRHRRRECGVASIRHWIKAAPDEVTSPIGVSYLSVCGQAAAKPRTAGKGALAAEGIRAVMTAGGRSLSRVPLPHCVRTTLVPHDGDPAFRIDLSVVVATGTFTHTKRTEIAAATRAGDSFDRPRKGPAHGPAQPRGPDAAARGARGAVPH